MKIVLGFILYLFADIVPMGDAFLNNLQKRDSVLVGDRLEYGIRLDTVHAMTGFLFPEFKSGDTLTVVRGWQLDTSNVSLRKRTFTLKGSILLSPFEEGIYKLPPLAVVRAVGEKIDTLIFSSPELEVKPIPIDTASFVIHDIKPQIRYPVTLGEILPWIGAAGILGAAVAMLIWLARRRRMKEDEEKAKDPAHIVALRKLEKYRGDKYWAPDKQKAFYSGVTDTLKTYMEARFGVDAPEMTTAEVFDALKAEKDITPELFSQTRELFETADFVKFAKHAASDEYNAKVVPVAVRFVTDTYRSTLEEERKEDVL